MTQLYKTVEDALDDLTNNECYKALRDLLLVLGYARAEGLPSNTKYVVRAMDYILEDRLDDLADLAQSMIEVE